MRMALLILKGTTFYISILVMTVVMVTLFFPVKGDHTETMIALGGGFAVILLITVIVLGSLS